MRGPSKRQSGLKQNCDDDFDDWKDGTPISYVLRMRECWASRRKKVHCKPWGIAMKTPLQAFGEQMQLLSWKSGMAPLPRCSSTPRPERELVKGSAEHAQLDRWSRLYPQLAAFQTAGAHPDKEKFPNSLRAWGSECLWPTMTSEACSFQMVLKFSSVTALVIAASARNNGL